MTRRALSDRPWCSACPRAFCEDHLPTTAEIIGQCKRFQALGQKHPAQACFIRCDADCIKWAAEDGGEQVEEAGITSHPPRLTLVS